MKNLSLEFSENSKKFLPNFPDYPKSFPELMKNWKKKLFFDGSKSLLQHPLGGISRRAGPKNGQNGPSSFGCLSPHHFLVGLAKNEGQQVSSIKILVNPAKSLFGCPNPHKSLEAPTKFLWVCAIIEILYDLKLLKGVPVQCNEIKNLDKNW